MMSLWPKASSRSQAVARLRNWFSTDTVTHVKSQVMFGPYGSGGVVTGHVSPGFEDVRQAFEEGFALNQELGAQCVMYRGEEKVVDLFGSNSKQPAYTGDTLQCVFSSGKNMESIIVAMLVDRGLLAYDAKVCAYWPEFANNGKDTVTIADVMRHEGGLPVFCGNTGIDGNLVVVSEEAVRDPSRIDTIIEDAFLWRDDSAPRVYHAITRGWIVSGLVRRVDTQKRSLGQFMHDEISKPLGLKYFCGIPEREQSKYTFADMTQMSTAYHIGFEIIPAALGMGCPYLAATLGLVKDRSNPLLKPVVSWIGKPPKPNFNNSSFGRAVEIPSAGMHGNARSMAKVNACMANGGAIHGVRIMSDESCADALAGLKWGEDRCVKLKSCFTQAGLAEMDSLDSPLLDPSCRMPGWYGWGGWGGSISIWNPQKKLAFSYTMNAMQSYLLGGPKFKPMAQALNNIE